MAVHVAYAPRRARGGRVQRRDHIILAIDSLPRDIGVLIIDHDMDLVFRFAQRITVMVGGTVFATGTPREIGADAKVRAVYLGQGGGGWGL